MAMDADKSGQKQRGRPFQKGQSGNPSGRPPGSRNRVLVALDQAGEDAAPRLLATLIKAGMAGDVAAAKLVMDRIWPAQKSRPVALDLPAITDAGSLLAAMSRIIEATARGEISPDEAQGFAAIVESTRKTIETAEIERRISELEAADEDI